MLLSLALPWPGFITLGDLKKRLGVFYQVSHTSALQCMLGGESGAEWRWSGQRAERRQSAANTTHSLHLSISLSLSLQNLSLREYKFLMNNKQELTEADLLALLSNNELTNYDPVAEAFKCYDPNDTGYIDLDVFREILTNLGFGDITDQDIQTLIDTCDVDGDGRVSLADFRRMLPSGPAPPSAAAAAAAGSSSAAPTAGIKK